MAKEVDDKKWEAMTRWGLVPWALERVKEREREVYFVPSRQMCFVFILLFVISYYIVM